MARKNGGGDRGNPWESGGSLPPDVEDLFRQGRNQIRNALPKGAPRGLLGYAANKFSKKYCRFFITSGSLSSNVVSAGSIKIPSP